MTHPKAAPMSDTERREGVVLRLARIDSKERLILCEGVLFESAAAVDTTLRRARISGRVEINGRIENHFADILDAEGGMVDTVALDRRSYAALKNRWMRCKVDKELSA